MNPARPATIESAARDLLAVLRGSRNLADLPPDALDRVLRLARRASVLGRLARTHLDSAGGERLDPKACELLLAARTMAEHHVRNIRWEVDRIRRALRPTGVRVVLLKGAAYETAGLPAARGRLASDVDILVPRDRIADVESALLAAGWVSDRTDAYDQRYYRQWMHELPPLRHGERGTLLDVHHTIAPLTSRRVRPDPARLLDGIVAAPGRDTYVLGPADMVVHSAIHAFHDGDLSSALRDLVDLDDLLRHFAVVEDRFWEHLLAGAAAHRAERPLFYAVRYAERWLGTPVPAAIHDSLAASAPSGPALSSMDRMVATVLFPELDSPRSARVTLATTILYARSHGLRMPVHLLTVHLLRKLVRRGSASEDATGAAGVRA